MAQKVITQFDADTKGLTSKVDKATGSAKKKIKGVETASNQLSKSFKNLGVTLLAAFSAQQIVNQLVQTVRTFQNFEQAIANLGAVSQASGKELLKLSKEAQALGASTKFTATEVASLQTNLAKLGFTTKEISDATPGILALAAATGEDLATSADVAGATIRGFGLDAAETGKVVDVMAASFSKSALDLSNFQEAMKLVAPIAKAANLPVETTTALLGKLADAGLRGSIAGTSLKNLLSKLSDANSDLSKSLGFAVTDTESLFKAFDILKDSNIDLTAATELTDERSKAAFLTLIEGGEAARFLSEELENAAGTADKMAKQQLDTLEGSLTLLGSAFNGLQIAIGKKLAPQLRRSADALTAFISSITPGINEVIKSERQLAIEQDKRLDVSKKEEEQGLALLASFDKLNKDGIDPNGIEQQKLNKLVREAATLFGESVVQIDNETGALKLNRGELVKQITARNLLKNEAVREILAQESRLIRQIDLAKNAEDQLNAIVASTNKIIETTVGGQQAIIATEDETIRSLANAAKLGFGAFADEVDRIQLEPISEGTRELMNVIIPQLQDVAKAVDGLTRNEQALAIVQGTITRLGINRNLLFGNGEDGANGNKDAVDGLTKAEKELIKVMLQQLKLQKQISTEADLDALVEAEKKRIAIIAAGEKKRLNIVEEGARLADELNRDHFDLLTEFYLSDFENFKDFEAKKREEMEETTSKQKEELGKRKELEEAFENAVIDFGHSLFDFQSSMRERELIALEKQKANELELAGDNEQAREEIEEKFEEKRKQILRAQAQDDRNAALFDIFVNTARNIVDAGTNLPLAILMAASGALQAAAVASRPIPEFADGTPFVQLNGNKKGRDTIPAMLDEGERVISAKKNKDNWDLYNAIDRGTLDKYILQNYVLPQLKAENLLGNNFAQNVGRSIKINNKINDRNIVSKLDKIANLNAQMLNNQPRFNPRKI